VPLRAPVTSRRGDLVVPRYILQREKARSGASPARSLLSFRRNFFPRRLFHSFAYSVRVKTGKFHLKILKKRKRRPAATKRDHALPLAPGAAPPPPCAATSPRRRPLRLRRPSASPPLRRPDLFLPSAASSSRSGRRPGQRLRRGIRSTSDCVPPKP